MMKKLLLLIICSCIGSALEAQIGGRQTFEFLRVPAHARLAGLGGVNVSLQQEEVNMFLDNPALLQPNLAKKAAFSYSPWHAGINNFSLVYVQPFSKIGNVGFGARMLNYGSFDQTNASGQVLGDFKANDFALQATYAFEQDNFRFGASLKFLGSQIESFGAYALAVDLGAVFTHPVQDWAVGLAIKNLGFPVSKYTETGKTNLPLDVQLGTSFKPSAMPFRFSVTLHHLYQFDIVYLDPARSTRLDANGNVVSEEKTFFDKLARHFVVGGELLLAKGFHINLGYNHLINREMRVENIGGLRGISLGFLLKVKAFSLSYAYGTYHVGAGRSFFTLGADLQRFGRKKRTKSQDSAE